MGLLFVDVGLMSAFGAQGLCLLPVPQFDFIGNRPKILKRCRHKETANKVALHIGGSVWHLPST